MLRKTRGKRKIFNKKKSKKHYLRILKASVDMANSNADLSKDLGDLKHYKSASTGNCFDISCLTFADCPQDLLSWMMELLEQNMAELYAACDWGWDIEEKRKEISDKAARFIVAFSENNKPVAFTHFRFDLDNDASVVYCYELQVDKSAQKQGIAKHVMKVLESLCQHHNMSKVVLTVFNHNENAYMFFTSQGYKLDETSPQNHGLETFYSILSKVNSEYSMSE